MNELLTETIRPLMDCESSMREHRKALHEMFVLAVANAPDNETDNHTAKRLAPTYLALVEFLENVHELN